MSLLETSSINIGREYTYGDVERFNIVIATAGAIPDGVDYQIAAILSVLRILDIAKGRVPSTEAARLHAEGLLKEAYAIFGFQG